MKFIRTFSVEEVIFPQMHYFIIVRHNQVGQLGFVNTIDGDSRNKFKYNKTVFQKSFMKWTTQTSRR